MLRVKTGASIISLCLCAVAVSFIVSALVVATNNSAMYRAELIASKQNNIIENSAYIKVYEKGEIIAIARQAFANNYLDYYDGEVDLEGLEALVIGEVMQTIPLKQLDGYEIYVTADGVNVK